MQFYIGLHQPSDARHFDRCLISIARLRKRQSNFKVNRWMLDSGAYTELADYGRYRDPVEVYAGQIERWSWCGQMDAAVGQDYMCAPHVLKKTGLSIAAHQRLSVERYDALRALVHSRTYVLPTLQGWQPEDYAQHVRDYGQRLTLGAWVGVGSVAARSEDTALVLAILKAIKQERPDLKIHGFGLKAASFAAPEVAGLLYSADSIAWSMAARREGRSREANDWREARRYLDRIETLTETTKCRPGP